MYSESRSDQQNRERRESGIAAHLFVKHEADQHGGTLSRCQLVESSAEDHLGEEEFVSGTDLARNPGLFAEHVVGRCETESSQYSLPVLQLLQLQDVLDLRDFPLGSSDRVLEVDIVRVFVV